MKVVWRVVFVLVDIGLFWVGIEVVLHLMVMVLAVVVASNRTAVSSHCPFVGSGMHKLVPLEEVSLHFALEVVVKGFLVVGRIVVLAMVIVAPSTIPKRRHTGTGTSRADAALVEQGV